MKSLCVFLLATGTLLAADGPGADDRSKKDLDRLQGTWLTTSLVNDGNTVAGEKIPSEGPPTNLVFDGNKWIIKVGGKTVATGIVKIDATKTPKEIDILDESGAKNDKTKLGIYELNGDIYKYCLAPAGKARPKEFTSNAGSGYSLGVSQREKAAPK